MKPEIGLAYCKGCNICIYMCPKKCYSKGADISERGYFAAVVSDPENCFNHDRSDKLICELCILSCPDQAISWVPESKGGDEG
ncbi:MAG: ferredoxin family protein [Methanobacteriota archaeon]|nr:MAG: ferredoxin family protein [Euryarchaeota archaeon]